jgi:glutamyl endopeptidase
MFVRRTLARLAAVALVGTSALAAFEANGYASSSSTAPTHLPPDTAVSRVISANSKASARHFPSSNPHVSWNAKGSKGFRGTGKLADARSKGDVAPKDILGSTDRRVPIADSTAYPNRAITAIDIYFSNGQQQLCTGFFYSPGTIATAGHCVYDSTKGGWITAAVVYPGRSGANLPYGSCDATEADSVVGWVNSTDYRYDYGALKLDCSAGDTVGWFGLYWQPTTLQAEPITITGYPAEKIPAYTQWSMSGQIALDLPFPYFYYDIDTTGGQSGSPLDDQTDIGGFGSDVAIGIHILGRTSFQPNFNAGNRLSQESFDDYESWAT